MSIAHLNHFRMLRISLDELFFSQNCLLQMGLLYALHILSKISMFQGRKEISSKTLFHAICEHNTFNTQQRECATGGLLNQINDDCLCGFKLHLNTLKKKNPSSVTIAKITFMTGASRLFTTSKAYTRLIYNYINILFARVNDFFDETLFPSEVVCACKCVCVCACLERKWLFPCVKHLLKCKRVFHIDFVKISWGVQVKAVMIKHWLTLRDYTLCCNLYCFNGHGHKCCCFFRIYSKRSFASGQ